MKFIRLYKINDTILVINNNKKDVLWLKKHLEQNKETTNFKFQSIFHN